MTRPRTLARPKAQYPALVQQQLNSLERELGGRQQLCSLLVLAPLTPDLKVVLGLLGDPRNTPLSLAQLCAEANLLPGTLLEQLAAGALLRGRVLAQQRIGEGIAAVAADVMRRAAPYEETCHVCLGTGSVTPEPTADAPNPPPGPCSTCRGAGALHYLPDLDRQKLAIEMAQLLPKGGGINIGIQQVNGQVAGAAGGGALEQLHQATDQILYGDGGYLDLPPLDGDLIPSEEGTGTATEHSAPADPSPPAE